MSPNYWGGEFSDQPPAPDEGVRTEDSIHHAKGAASEGVPVQRQEIMVNSEWLERGQEAVASGLVYQIIVPRVEISQCVFEDRGEAGGVETITYNGTVVGYRAKGYSTPENTTLQ